MTEEEKIRDIVAWQNRLDITEIQALIDGKIVIKNLYIDGKRYLRVSFSILDLNKQSQVVEKE